ncbi:response regulator transcription factor [Luteibacter aegosomaticola]|uniref:response regulator n=1 Tax=Luteibacter aegosomaticola TaxID=2911538 RepID=UPI001FF9E825|nr:response regulator transcription factor [Luteibacter aegosomaticola]UPG91324.1 response regulator transcription factor [Luteibacter aegosomaticola]
MHILLIEDDAQLGDAIRRALERLAHTITWLRDGDEALKALREHDADLVLLDLGLPGRDGLDVLTEARRLRVTTPVIVMSARDQLDGRIQVLDAGADDYLVKPFHLEELAARIRSLSRRARGDAVNRLEAGALSMDLGTFDVAWRGAKVDLTRREFALLQALMERAGRIVRRETLESTLYGPENAVSTSALEVLVHALRRKLSPEAIQTVRGFGYMVPREPV